MKKMEVTMAQQQQRGDDSALFLQPFISKLGHDLQEIRVRALKAILFKLEHKLICAADLVQERELLIRLLEWFNDPRSPMKKEVLGLLESLAKHISAAEILINIGAIEFLSNLRQDIDPELYQSVDNVTHQLLSIPQSTGSMHNDWCLYKPCDNHLQDDRTVCHDGQLKSSSFPVLSNTCPPPTTGLFSQSAPLLTQPSTGYYDVQQESPVPSDRIAQPSNENASESHESFSSGSSSLTFFQWVSLSSSDGHIMTVTNSRLHNCSSTLVAKSCEFLADVLFKDFPAEIFLQRPSVFKSLLELLEFRTDGSDGVSVPVCAVHCLKELCCHVHARLMATSDPSFFCPNRDCWKSHQNILSKNTSSDVETSTVNQGDQHTQLRGSGDGGLGSDGASSTTSEQATSTIDDEDDIAIEALQYNQLSVEEMCVVVLAHGLEFLRGQLSSNLQVVTITQELLFHVADLIKMVAPDDLWCKGSQANAVMASTVLSCFKLLGEVIVHHVQYSGYQGHANKPDPNLPTHRTAVINFTSLLVQLLYALVPIQQANSIIPTDVVTVIWLLTMDGILSKTHPLLHSSLLEYLEVLDQSSHQTYTTTMNVCQSFESTCKLLKSINSQSSVSSTALLALADKSTIGLAYHMSSTFITQSVKLCSAVCSSNNDPSMVQGAHRVLLRIIAHYDKSIRHEGYKQCLCMVKESLRISHVTHPMSNVCNGILFLLNGDVMKEICCFGLYDECKEVQSIAVDILENLFLGRLSMRTQLWRRLLDVIIPSLPHLGGYIGTHPTLDQCLLEIIASTGAMDSGLVTADGQVMSLQPLQQLRAALRLLFKQDPNLRTQGLAVIVGHLTSDKTKTWGQRLFQSRQSENLRDLFVVDQLTSTMHSHTPVSHPSVEKTEINKLWSIYSSKHMDWSIRKSAAEQLSIILQDPDWHTELLDLKVDESTVNILLEILETSACTHTPTTPAPCMELVPPCLKILRLLTEYSWSCRHRIASKISIYSTVVMCAVVCRHSVQVNYEAACLLSILLFDEVALSSVDKSAFSLPALLVQRYQLPFNTAVHRPISDYQYQVPQDPDPLKSFPALSTLRFYWNLAWYESLDKLCGVQGIDDIAPSGNSLYCKEFQWTSVDQQILSCSYTKNWLTENLSNINKATSHYPAMLAMNRLHSSLVGDLGMTFKGTRIAVEILYTLHWQDALERYLLVFPNSIEDDKLLIQVLKILSSMLTSPSLPPLPVLAWISRITIQRDSPLLGLLRTNIGQTDSSSLKASNDSRRSLRSSILQFYNHLIKHLCSSPHPWRCDGERVLIGELVHAVTLNLDLADNPAYYDLPVLETALECLSQMTGRSQWSVNSKSQDANRLCTGMLASLVQVVNAFSAGRLGSTTSFMGKGVTYHASLCLVHLAHEMKSVQPERAWVSPWINSDDSDSHPLTWLVTLWYDRSPELRWMGLSIATTISSSLVGCACVVQALDGVSGGVIARVLALILDDGDCGMVRQQAALLMCHIVSHLSQTDQQHIDVKDPLPDLVTLTSILDHFKFFNRLQSILSSFSTYNVPLKSMSSQACQSSVSVSTTSSNIPYHHLQSSSQSASLVSDTHNQSPIPNGRSSPGEQSTVTMSNGSVMSSVQTQESFAANSLVPLLNERGLPSGMSTSSSTASTYIASKSGSLSSQTSSLMSSLTPSYVGALAQLVETLVVSHGTYTISAIKQVNMLNVFWSHLDSSELQIFLQAQLASSEPLSSAAILVVRDVIHMCTCLVQLAHVLARADHTLLFDLQQSTFTMHKIIGLLAINTSNLDTSLTDYCHKLWLAVCTLPVTLLQSQGPVTVSSITEETIYTHWSSFTEIFTSVIANQNSPQPLRGVLLKLLGLVLSCEGKRQKQKNSPEKNNDVTYKNKLTDLLDRNVKTTAVGEDGFFQEGTNNQASESTPLLISNRISAHSDEIQTVSSGSVLCKTLLACYDKFASKLQDNEKKAKAMVKICITGLLGLSRSAKETAQAEGFVEITIEHIKHLHVQLNMDSLQLGRGPSWKNKDNPIIDEIISDLQLLENFIHRYNDGKLACIECNIIDILHKLWPWCNVEVTLRNSVISFLCTLTAKCQKASIFIGGGSSSSRASQSGSTLLNSLLKAASTSSTKVLGNQICHDLDVQMSTFKALANLISNLVLTNECRGIIWKSNFLHHFSKLKPLKSSQNRPKHIHRVVGMAWLSILVNLTFFTDGQQMVMKVPGCVSILLEFCQVTQGKLGLSNTALLVLRNLCFHSNCKSVLLSNGTLVSHLIANIDNPSTFTCALAASALCSLVYNNHKAKVTLKNSGLLKKLEEFKLKSDNEIETPQQDQKHYRICREALENLTENIV